MSSLARLDIVKAELGALSPDELEAVMLLLEDEPGFGGELLELLQELQYEWKPVDMETWLRHPDYMGETGRELWPQIVDDLVEFFEGDYNVGVFTGGVGWGKSTIAEFGIARMAYECGCYHNPQSSLGLMSGDTIALMNISVSEFQARKVIFKGIRDKVSRSPFFREQLPYDPHVVTELRFPKDIWISPAASTDTSMLGMHVIGAAMDETNFMQVVEKSKAADPSRKGKKYDFAETMYRTILTRMKSRYQRMGRLPGKIMLISSKTHPDTFMERLVDESKGDPMFFVRDYPTWGPQPKERFCGKKFYVVVGDMYRPSHILGQGDEIQEGEKLVEVPVEFQEDFVRDIDYALRELAGVATLSINPYFVQWNRVMRAFPATRPHPFTMIETTLQDGAEFIVEELCEDVKGKKVPLDYPEAPRWVHIDPSLTGDATGICMGCICDLEDLIREDDEGVKQLERLPVFWIDFMLRIMPPHRGEIEYRAVRQLVYDLEAMGFPVRVVSMDRFAGPETLQIYRRHGYETLLLSVDTAEGYNPLKSAFYDGRIQAYRYDPVVTELRQLEWNKVKGKPDHPTRGCFVGDTRIPLLDGTTPMIKELNNKDVWVYSATSDGRIVPGKARGRVTKKVTYLVDVVLDSGAVERCTAEHLWMLRDGSYKPAKDLRPGIDRLMPIKRQWPVNGGYERVVDKDGDRMLTHHMVIQGITGQVITQGECVHHKDGDKLNNLPGNLSVEAHAEHCRTHTVLRHRIDSDYHEAVKRGAQIFNLSERGRKIHAKAVRKTMAAMTPDDFKARARKNPNFRSDVDYATLERIKTDPEATNANAAARIIGCGRNVVIRVLREHGFESWDAFTAEQGVGFNHKVRAIIPVKFDDPVEVYDLEVDKWNNFALCSGVFVHNSKDVADALAGVVLGLTTYMGGMINTSEGAKGTEIQVF